MHVGGRREVPYLELYLQQLSIRIPRALRKHELLARRLYLKHIAHDLPPSPTLSTLNSQPSTGPMPSRPQWRDLSPYRIGPTPTLGTQSHVRTRHSYSP